MNKLVKNQGVILDHLDSFEETLEGIKNQMQTFMDNQTFFNDRIKELQDHQKRLSEVLAENLKDHYVYIRDVVQEGFDETVNVLKGKYNTQTKRFADEEIRGRRGM